MTSFIDDDGNELEYNGKDFAVTKQAISFYQFKFKGNFSTNVKIAGTIRNRSIFGYYGDNQLTPITRKIFNVFRDGNKVDRGYVVIITDGGDEIECFFASGNATWFSLWDFKCNEIVTTKWDVRFYYGDGAIGSKRLHDTWTHTEGIIFPVVDWIYGGEKFTNNFNLFGNMFVSDTTDGTLENKPLREFYPCLYVHTLVKELANHSGTNIGGNIFSDPLFLKLIITPNDPEDWINSTDSAPLIVKPEQIAPEMKAIDFIKWVCFSFGCILTFDNDSNTISINQVDKIDDTVDWSEFYISHKTEVSKYYQKNYIRYKQTEDQENIKEYNANRIVQYGDILIESDKTDGSDNELYEAPFLPSYDLVGTSQLKWATPDIGFWKLEDRESYAFTSVTDSSTFATFNGTFPFDGLSSLGQIVRIVSDNGKYDGYHYSRSTNVSTEYRSSCLFRGDTTGYIITQTATAIKGHRILVCVPNVSPSVCMQYGWINIADESLAQESYSYTTIATAYFHKSDPVSFNSGLSAYSGLNAYKQGLAYGQIDGRGDIPLSDKYLNTYKKILKSPPIKAKMLLPQADFFKYNFEKVYLKTKNLTGYFMVESISNYVDSVTPVDVYLTKI